MAHFAKLNSSNIVVDLQVVDNNNATTEQEGIDFLNNLYSTNDVWKQTSYNTYGGKHLLGGTPFRKNFAALGFTYDETRDAFYSPPPYPSWTLNETTCLYDPPVDYPNDGNTYTWNETNQTWDLLGD